MSSTTANPTATSSSSSSSAAPTAPGQKKKILLLNGPNLNLLGTREPGIYGSDTLPMIEQRAATHAQSLGAELVSFQTNFEGELLERIHRARNEGVTGIVVCVSLYFLGLVDFSGFICCFFFKISMT